MPRPARPRNALQRRSVMRALGGNGAWLGAAAVIAAFLFAGCGGGEASREPDRFAPSWSPDGRSILFQVDPNPRMGCPYGACAFRYEVWLVRSDGGRMRRLAVGHSAAWSPDGRAIAFEQPSDAVYTVRVDGTRLRRLTQGLSKDARGATWSPDGKRIAFVSWVQGPGELDISSRLYVMNADGSKGRRLTRLQPYEVAWSPTGAIALSTFEGLFTIDAEGRHLRKLFGTDHGGIGDGIAWSPDGTRIAFALERDERVGFAVVDTHGHVLLPAVLRTPRQPVLETDMAWSPDGRRIAFSAWAQGESGYVARGIYVMGARGGVLERLTASGGEPAWSPDGRLIAFSDEGDLQVMNADGSGRRSLSDTSRP